MKYANDGSLQVSVASGATTLSDILLSDAAGVLFIARDNGTTLSYARVDTGAAYVPVAPITIAKDNAAHPIENFYNVGALAANAIWYTPVIDLGAANTRRVGMKARLSAVLNVAGNYLIVQNSSDGVTWQYAPFDSGNGVSWGSLSSGQNAISCSVIARFVRASIASSAIAVTSAAVILTID